MFTKKSLVVCLVMVLALLGFGTVSTFAASVKSSHPQKTHPLSYSGVAAVTPTRKGVLSVEEVENYLKNSHFVGGSTLNGNAPTIQNLRLTDVTHLNKLVNVLIPVAGVVIPGLLGTRKIYYAQVDGPFALDPDMPLSALSTLFPGSTNSPILYNLPVLKNLPVMSDLNTITGVNDPSGLLGLSSQNDESQPKSVLLNNVLQTIYEIFDAKTGNLLAWG